VGQPLALGKLLAGDGKARDVVHRVPDELADLLVHLEVLLVDLVPQGLRSWLASSTAAFRTAARFSSAFLAASFFCAGSWVQGEGRRCRSRRYP